MKFTIYTLSTGEIERTVDCPENLATLQAGDGEGVAAGEFSELDFWMDAGQPRAYTPEQAAAKRQRPEWAERWDNATMTWPDSRSIDRLRMDKWAEIKAARDADEFGPFVAGGMEFDGDEKSQQRIQGAVQLASLALAAQEPFVIDWTLADNSTAALTAQQVLDVGRALAGKIQMVYAHARGLRQRIAQAATAEEIAAITWA